MIDVLFDSGYLYFNGNHIADYQVNFYCINDFKDFLLENLDSKIMLFLNKILKNFDYKLMNKNLIGTSRRDFDGGCYHFLPGEDLYVYYIIKKSEDYLIDFRYYLTYEDSEIYLAFKSDKNIEDLLSCCENTVNILIKIKRIIGG